MSSLPLAEGDARRTFSIKPQKETNDGVAQDFWTSKKRPDLKHIKYIYFYISSRETLSETFMATYGLHMMALSSDHPK